MPWGVERGMLLGAAAAVGTTAGALKKRGRHGQPGVGHCFTPVG